MWSENLPDEGDDELDIPPLRERDIVRFQYCLHADANCLAALDRRLDAERVARDQGEELSELSGPTVSAIAIDARRPLPPDSEGGCSDDEEENYWMFVQLKWILHLYDLLLEGDGTVWDRQYCKPPKVWAGW